MIILSGGPIRRTFIVRDAEGADSVADLLPTAVMLLDGEIVAGSVTITNKSGGRYKLSATGPTGANGQTVEVRATVIVGGVTHSEIVYRAVIAGTLVGGDLVSGGAIAGTFFTHDSDGANVAADDDPTALLVLDGDDDEGEVTITDKTGGRYKFEATGPAGTAGQVVEVLSTSVIDGVTQTVVVWAGVIASDVDPLAAHSPQRQKGRIVTTLVDETGFTLPITAFDENNEAVSLAGKTLRHIVTDVDGEQLSTTEITSNTSTFNYPVLAAQTGDEAIDGNAHYWKLIEELGGGAEKVVSFGRQLVKRTARSAAS